jgi:hypothetical protein
MSWCEESERRMLSKAGGHAAVPSASHPAIVHDVSHCTRTSLRRWREAVPLSSTAEMHANACINGNAKLCHPFRPFSKLYGMALFLAVLASLSVLPIARCAGDAALSEAVAAAGARERVVGAWRNGASVRNRTRRQDRTCFVGPGVQMDIVIVIDISASESCPSVSRDFAILSLAKLGPGIETGEGC